MAHALSGWPEMMLQSQITGVCNLVGDIPQMNRTVLLASIVSSSSLLSVRSRNSAVFCKSRRDPLLVCFKEKQLEEKIELDKRSQLTAAKNEVEMVKVKLEFMETHPNTFTREVGKTSYTNGTSVRGCCILGVRGRSLITGGPYQGRTGTFAGIT